MSTESNADNPIIIPKSKTHPYDPSHSFNLDDATKMNDIHEAPLLELLRRRYSEGKIYTSIGDVLISVNPYENIPTMYDLPYTQISDGERGSESEHAGSVGEEVVVGEEEKDIRSFKQQQLAKPHVYSTSDKAFSYMTALPGELSSGQRTRHMNQSIVITGESGAGKTEASKYVMQYLISRAPQLLKEGGQNGEQSRDEAIRIQNMLFESNIVLEAFGNAKTLRNDNSSRFGKYIKMLYNNSSQLVGAKTEHFLLEKSRLVSVNEDERGYHIFYQLCRGADATMHKNFHLSSPERFKSTSMGGCTDIADCVDDCSEFAKTCHALETLGFDNEARFTLWRVLAAILHLSNVAFEDSENEDCHASMSTNDLISKHELAKLVGLEVTELEKRILNRSLFSANGSTLRIPLNSRQAKDNLDALIKYIYGQVFAWINWKINCCHRVRINSENKDSSYSEEEVEMEETSVRSFIGILDIFGFEIMNTNSFEQLCISFANEVLQKQFNDHTFILEHAEYEKEGIDVPSIPFRNNEHIIDLISAKPMVLLPMLEDCALTGRKAHGEEGFSNKHLLNLYHQQHLRVNPHPNYEKPRFKNDQSILRHFAGQVPYDIDGFLEKNNDALHYDLKMLMTQSKDPFLLSLIPEYGTGSTSPHEFRNWQKIREKEVDFSNPIRISGSDSGIDELPESLLPNAIQQQMLSSSPIPSPVSGSDSKLANLKTVSASFRQQLERLVKQLYETEPYHIKCIKPNGQMAPGVWSSPLVFQQLRYSGALEVVRIRTEAFPTRMHFKEFYKRFHQLIHYVYCEDDLIKEQFCTLAEEICAKALNEDDYVMGNTKVFVRNYGLEKLYWALHCHFTQAATKIQAAFRGITARELVCKQRNAMTLLQNVVWKWFQRRYARKVRQTEIAQRLSAAITLQAVTRRFFAVTRLRRERETQKANKLQKWAHACLVRKNFQRLRRAATVIQSRWRCHAALSDYHSIRNHTVGIQAGIRMFLQLQRYRRKVHSVVKIQAFTRQFLARSQYLRYRSAVKRIQISARTYIRNRYLTETVVSLFNMAREGLSDGIMTQMAQWPELLFVRSKRDDKKSFKTVLHVACESGATDIVKLLQPFPEDVIAHDKFGDSCIHKAAEIHNYDLMKYLVKRFSMDIEALLATGDSGTRRTVSASSPSYLENAHQDDAIFKLRLNKAQSTTRTVGETRVQTVDTSTTSESVTLVSGYLKKRRENDRWLKRWCVLTETSILYYRNKNDTEPSKCIRVENAMLKKSNVSCAFEIHSPDLLNSRNKEGRIYF